MAKTKVLGLDRLNRKVRAMDRRIKDAIREALAESGDEIVAMMKRLVPVDKGELRDSIGWTFGQPPDGSISLGSIGQSGKMARDERNLQGLRITIFAGNSKAYYARWVEFGTSAGKRGGRASYVGARQNKQGRTQRRTHPGTPAQPFFYVAWRALRRRVRGRVTRKMNKAIKEVAANG